MRNRTFWQDHVTQFEDRFREINNPDGTITHTPVEGEIIQQGTPQNAANFNNIEENIIGAGEIGAELARQMRLQRSALNMVRGETGEITLRNTLNYPFNNSAASVALRETRDTTDYTVDVDTGAAGGMGRIVITDKLRNGFRIAFTGGAASVAVRYTVRGGTL